MERERFISNVRETGKSMLWRDEKEARKMPNDAERALVLSFRRALRAYKDT
jgi:hypothetical protein